LLVGLQVKVWREENLVLKKNIVLFIKNVIIKSMGD